MPRDEVPELIQLCASILDDGEVTSDEAYQIADWLNKHPEASERWPGKELIEPLQKIWADGSVNRRELHWLARLLISIQREWARHPKTEITSTTDNSIREFSIADIDDVRLPSLHGRFRVPSQSERGRFYEVDLRGPSCTCPDWRTWRSQLPPGDLTRCCKHVLHVYATLARRGKTDGWLAAFIDGGWPAHPGAQWHLMAAGADKVLFCTASERGWANVFAKEGRSYARFGYNVDEHRWAYSVEPAGGEAIAHAITTFGKKSIRKNRDDIAPLEREVLRPRSQLLGFWVFAAIFTVIGFFALMQYRRASSTRLDGRAITTPSAEPSTVQSSIHTPTSQSAPLAEPTTNSFPPRVKAIRTIRVETGRGQILIPSKTELRVLSREGSNLLVSYHGWTVAIPESTVSVVAP
jgi:hypothetical protein